jgi:hypothetical protein
MELVQDCIQLKVSVLVMLHLWFLLRKCWLILKLERTKQLYIPDTFFRTMIS